MRSRSIHVYLKSLAVISERRKCTASTGKIEVFNLDLSTGQLKKVAAFNVFPRRPRCELHPLDTWLDMIFAERCMEAIRAKSANVPFPSGEVGEEKGYYPQPIESAHLQAREYLKITAVQPEDLLRPWWSGFWAWYDEEKKQYFCVPVESMIPVNVTAFKLH